LHLQLLLLLSLTLLLLLLLLLPLSVSRRHPERSEGSLYFVVAVAVVSAVPCLSRNPMPLLLLHPTPTPPRYTINCICGDLF
jgi:hypothetical protein